MPEAVFFQRNFITEDLSAVAGMTTLLPIVGDIDTSNASLLLGDGTSAPEFITLQDGELQVSPTVADIGAYTLRIQWGDQVEHINISVLQASSAIVALDQLPANLPQFTALNLYSEDSVFNQALPEDPAIDPNSSDLLEGLQISEQFVVQVGQFSSTVFFAGNSTPTHDISLPCGDFWELGINSLTDIPVPDWATPSDDVDGGDEPPIDCGEDSG